MIADVVSVHDRDRACATRRAAVLEVAVRGTTRLVAGRGPMRGAMARS
jgi:hypothetical protein